MGTDLDAATMILGRDEMVRRAMAELDDDTGPEATDPVAPPPDERTMLLPRDALDRAAMLADSDEDDDDDSAMLDAATMMLSRDEMARRRDELLDQTRADKPRREAFTPPSKKR